MRLGVSYERGTPVTDASHLTLVDFDKERRCSQVGLESHARGAEMAHGPSINRGAVDCISQVLRAFWCAQGGQLLWVLGYANTSDFRCSQVGFESHAKGAEMAHGPHRRPVGVRCPRLPVSTLRG